MSFRAAHGLRRRPSVRTSVGSLLLLWAVLSGAPACSPETAPHPEPAAVAGEMPKGVVARVGRLDITAQAVAQIAAAQELSPDEALDRAVFDALCAAGAGESALASDRAVLLASHQVLERALDEQLYQQARATPIDSALYERVLEEDRLWIDVARPTGYRTVHATVVVPKDADAEAHRRARALAEQLHEAAAPAARTARETAPQPLEGRARFRFSMRAAFSDPAVLAFFKAMRPFEKQRGEFEIRVEPEAVVAKNGWLIDFNAPADLAYATEFTEAAARLTARGDLSEVVESPHGYHVIMLLEIIPGRELPEQERNAEIRPAIWARRAAQARAALLERLRKQTDVSLSRNVDALLEQLIVQP